MNIIGIGTDIVQIARINKTVDKHGARFAQRILHSAELERYERHSQPISYLAKRFAAKEAVAKALGVGIGKHVRLSEIESINDEMGKPSLQYHGATATFVQQQGVKQSFVSLSDERDYALAYVVLTG